MLHHFSIPVNPVQFRRDNRTFTPEDRAINESISSIKSLSRNMAEKPYQIRNKQYTYFTDLLYDLPSSVNQAKCEILIKLNYFIELGKNQKLLSIHNAFQLLSHSKSIRIDKTKNIPIPIEIIEKHSRKTNKTYVDCDINSILYDYETSLSNSSLPVQQQLLAEIEFLGYPKTRYKCNPDYCFVMSIDTRYSPKIQVYYLASGLIETYKIYKKNYFIPPDINYPNESVLFQTNDIISLNKIDSKHQKRKKKNKETGEIEWVELAETEEVISSVSMIKRFREE